MKYFKQKVTYGICDVDAAYQFYFKYLLGKLHEIFKWENLPDTIDEVFLNNVLFLSGRCCFTDKLDSSLRCYFGEIGGAPNIYYMPTQFIISNPVAGSEDIKIDMEKEGVVMYNSKEDKVYNFMPSGGGLFPLIHQTATLLADNIVSINTAQINSRVQAVAVTDDKNVSNSAEAALKQLYAGKPWTAMTENLINSIKINPISNPGMSNTISTLIELHQYIMADFYNSIGIKTNPVNKKERLITDEINSVDNYLAVTLEQMLHSRQEAVDKINAMYGTNISIKVADELSEVVEEATEPDKEVDSNEQLSDI